MSRFIENPIIEFKTSSLRFMRVPEVALCGLSLLYTEGFGIMFDELNTLGVDTGEGIFRFMNNEALYKQMLIAFAEMIREAQVTTEFDDKSYDKEIEKLHALKGAAGNLSIGSLYTAYAEIVRLLREGNIAEAKTEITKILPTQHKITECIEKYS